jgi:putative ABC transport system permease protein
MTPQTDQPPRLAKWFVAWRLPGEDREFALGDLDEEFRVLANSRDLRAARRWYWREAFRLLHARSGDPVVRSSQGGVPMTGLIQDIRFAARWLRRAPGFTLAALTSLALGIGATTALFSVVHAALFGPLPFPNAARVVVTLNGLNRDDATPLSWLQFRDWRDAAVFEDSAAYFRWTPTLTGEGDAEQLTGARASASLFSVLGVQPIRGQIFTREDEPPGAARKVLIGEALWHQRFGGADGVVGRSLRLSDATYTIVGVLPASFRLRPTDRPPDVIAPLRLTETAAPDSLHFMIGLAALRPGQTIVGAHDRLQAVARRLRPNLQPAPTVYVASIREEIAGRSRPILLVSLAAVGFLLLITCANLAHLLLARAMSRREEIVVRYALGAARARVVRQLLTESLVLAGAGGTLGVVLAWLGTRFLATTTVVQAAGVYDLHLRWPVLAFALAVSFLAGLLFGVAPAFDAGRQSLRAAMGSAARVTGTRSFIRSTLMIAELSLTLVLLVGVGLLIRSFANLAVVPTGFDADRLLTFSLSLPDATYPTPQAQVQFFQTTLDRLAHVPGVSGVGLVSEVPLAGGGTNGSIDIEGQSFPPGQEPRAEKRIVSPGYFETMHIPLIAGRTFTARDTTGAPPVMVVSESLARRYFKNRGAVGARASFDWDMDGSQDIVGVVADVKHYDLRDAPLPMVYVSYLQRPLTTAGLVVRTMGDPAGVVAGVRSTVRDIDRDRPLQQLETMSAIVSDSVATRRFVLIVSLGFAALAVLLAATGTYGAVSYRTRQRTREFGIRLALGATPNGIVRLALGQALLPVLLGLGAGLGGALALSEVMRSQLFGVTPTDPATFASVAVGLAAVAGAASYLPARRAIQVKAASVLRAE